MTAAAARAASRKPLLMGVVNITPDSFSDGGKWSTPEKAVNHVERLVSEGADIVDLGAESTRPGATATQLNEEWSRLEPVLKLLSQRSFPVDISIDTRKPEIMMRAAEYGATWFNDVAGHADIGVLKNLLSYPGMQYIAMHMPMTPDIMQKHPLPPRAAVTAVDSFFRSRCDVATAAGFALERIWLDPGIGFGKTDAANVQLMQEVGPWSKKYQVMVGVSRKSLIGRTLGINTPEERDAPSKMLEFGLIMLGAKLVRTHTVAPLRHLVNLLAEADRG
ncbi:MAG: hypothetical protein RL011_757 [Pseudomonadota bacterium]